MVTDLYQMGNQSNVSGIGPLEDPDITQQSEQGIQTASGLPGSSARMVTISIQGYV